VYITHKEDSTSGERHGRRLHSLISFKYSSSSESCQDCESDFQDSQIVHPQNIVTCTAVIPQARAKEEPYHSSHQA
jgi:hypothetical protein